MIYYSQPSDKGYCLDNFNTFFLYNEFKKGNNLLIILNNKTKHYEQISINCLLNIFISGIAGD